MGQFAESLNEVGKVWMELPYGLGSPRQSQKEKSELTLAFQ